MMIKIELTRSQLQPLAIRLEPTITLDRIRDSTKLTPL